MTRFIEGLDRTQTTPDFKTISIKCSRRGASKESAVAISSQQFVALCRDIDLLDAEIVAIDGSKFKAVNAKARNYTREKLRRRLGEIDEAIARYLAELDRADEVLSKTGMAMPEARMARAAKKLAHYKKEADTLRAVEKRMDTTGETQVSLTDPDCRSMATTSKQPRVVGYNVQSVVETKHHLIVAHEVTNLGYDREALSMMARAAKDVMASESIEAVADKGYYKGEEIVAAEQRRRYRLQTEHVRRSGGRPLRSRRLRLPRRQRRVSVPGRQVAHVSLHERGGRSDGSVLLDECLRNLRHQSQVHARQRAAPQAMGARSHSGARAGPSRRRSVEDPLAQQDGRASVRNDQGVDGRNALQDANYAARRDRDGAARARLQYDARHGRRRRAAPHLGNEGSCARADRDQVVRNAAPGSTSCDSWREMDERQSSAGQAGHVIGTTTPTGELSHRLQRKPTSSGLRHSFGRVRCTALSRHYAFLG